MKNRGNEWRGWLRCCGVALTMVFLIGGPGIGAAAERARDWGIPLVGEPGKWNAITDVDGVQVGHATIVRGEGALEVGDGPVRTGVTAILPQGRAYRPVFAATAALNGNGEMTGTEWVDESGYLAEPILLTNTHSIGAVHEAVIAWRAKAGYYQASGEYDWASLPVVAETWDGRLNDIHGFHVRRRHVFRALDRAAGGPVEEGNVGGGTGMICHQFKGGIGTASRRTEAGHTVGVLVQANYGKRENLTIAGIPVGRKIEKKMPEIESINPTVPANGGNSIIVIVATDAPVLPHQLERLAKRVPLGIAKVGGIGKNSSGDLFLAFSTANANDPSTNGSRQVTMLPNAAIDPLMQATVNATEEAILNALVVAETMTGINGNKVFELPRDRVRSILRHHRRLGDDVTGSSRGGGRKENRVEP